MTNRKVHGALIGGIALSGLALLPAALGAQEPTPQCNGVDATIVFESPEGFDDVVTGTDGDDVIVVLGDGVDFVTGGEGDDIICGGTTWALSGGPGDDVIFLGSGHGNVSGGPGNDTIYGTPNHDDLYGNEGDDIIFGAGGPDDIGGGEGDDVIYGGKGDDRIVGNLGRDRLYGGPGRDFLFANEAFTAGANNDRAFYPDSEFLDGPGTSSADTAGSLLYGGADADYLVGSDRWDRMRGGDGDDIILGYGGRDYIRGGRGNDLLLGGAGIDDVNGNTGKDQIVVQGADRGRGGYGTDTCHYGSVPATPMPQCEVTVVGIDWDGLEASAISAIKYQH